MIGFLITGHGEISIGIKNSLEMITGDMENIEAIPFYQDESLVAYETNIRDSIVKLNNSCSGVIIFADLMGGTPFRVAMLEADRYENIEVIVGYNLPMLVEGSVLRYGNLSAREVADELVKVGHEGLIRAEMKAKNNQDSVIEEGI